MPIDPPTNGNTAPSAAHPPLMPVTQPTPPTDQQCQVGNGQATRSLEAGRLESEQETKNGTSDPAALVKPGVGSDANDCGAKLHAAIANGDLDRVRALCESGVVDVNVRNEGGYTPIHRACSNGNMAMFKLLIKLGADIEANNDSVTPLHAAILAGQSNIVSKLHKMDADMHARCRIGATPLYLAAILKEVDTFAVLTTLGVNPLSTHFHTQRPELEQFIGLRGRWNDTGGPEWSTCNAWIKSMKGDTGDEKFGSAWIGKAIVRRLFGEQGNINQALAIDPEKRTPLEFALDHQWWALAQELVKAGAIRQAGLAHIQRPASA